VIEELLGSPPSALVGPAKPLGDAANVMGGLEERSPRLREHACPRDLLGERVESDGPLLQRLALELDTVPEDALDGRAVHVSREQRRRLYSYPPPSRVRGSPASQMGIAVAERAGARRHAQGMSPAGTVRDGRACPRLPRARRPRRGRRHPVAGVRGVASRLHGHNYVVSATIAGSIDPCTHFLVDFRSLDDLLREAVAPLDHRRLDVEYTALGDREPSTEALAVALFGALAPHVRSRLEQARLLGVRVAENDGLWADRREGGAVEVTRAYAFSAAHRLADPQRDDAENRRIYGKCANPQPHGHDYRFEVTVAGEPDPRTGLVADVKALDEAVAARVLRLFDHRYLNAEVPPFDRVQPTAERIAERIWELIAPDVVGLARVVVYETPRSAFAYAGPSR